MTISPAANSDTLLEQAATHFRAGRLKEAELLYRQALSARPECADIHAGLGMVLFLQARTEDALAALRRAAGIEPDNADILYKLGNMLLRDGNGEGRLAESFDCFCRHAELTFGAGAKKADEAAHRILHDREQKIWLAEHFGVTNWKFHLADGGRIAARTVNGANAAKAMEGWHSSRPQIVVIDDLLSDEALAKLRRYCLGSTIWRDTHPEGYLTAMPEHGLACPLIAQIDKDMRAAYPGILGNHLLRYLWAFKYDSSLNGVGTHADPSLVTFNFWITPDEANLDPEHGGLIVWDVAAPADWNSRRYIGDTAGCQAWLARMGAKSITIPYRANRAVVFSSALFHETDRMRFRDGYANRRINITMLYGRR
ncbi:MAG TPA: tetratricopeptide repeat protein [Rhizomicrobium sp.]|nr:tetratricopeptide repeat protein [Rhizomicrobium sp.]